MKKTLKENINYDKIENDVRKMMINDRVNEKVSVEGLRLSLEKIGDGEITENSSYDRTGDRLMYKEMLNNDTLILVVHGAYTGTPYNKFDYGYRYSIGLYRNNPRTVQYGGGYGVSGIIEKQHTKLISYSDYDINHQNEEIISEVCGYIKNKIMVNENMKKTITLKESELISLIETMIKEEQSKLPGKTVGDLKKILSMANPNGFLIMVDGDKGNWITHAAHLNVETYGYKLDGVDITKDKKFVGLPYYEEACLTNKSKNDNLLLKNEVKSIIKHKHIYPISHVMEQLKEYSDNDYLMLFDGSLVSDIKLNGNMTVGFKTIYGNCETFISAKNDFVFIIKGEKTKSFFRRGETNESVKKTIKEYGEDSGGQDMTWGIYSRNNGGGVDQHKLMSSWEVAKDIEEVLPENYLEDDVESAVDDYIENNEISKDIADKIMSNDEWWGDLYYNINDIRRKKNIKEEKNTKKSVTIIKWFFGSDTNENEMSVKLMSDEEISKFVEQLKSKKIKYKLNNTGFYKNTPKIEYWKTKNIKEETGTASVGGFEPALDQPIRKKIRTGLTKEEFNQLKEYMRIDENLEEGKKKTGSKLCSRGKSAAKAKFKVYPSAYANGYAVQVCKGRMPGLDGKKRCSGSYC